MSGPFTQAQHLAVLLELTTAAGRDAELARMIQASAGDELQTDVLAAAIEVTAQRMGWLGTVARQSHGDKRVACANADAWLMPPAVIAEGATAHTGRA